MMSAEPTSVNSLASCSSTDTSSKPSVKPLAKTAAEIVAQGLAGGKPTVMEGTENVKPTSATNINAVTNNVVDASQTASSVKIPTNLDPNSGNPAEGNISSTSSSQFVNDIDSAPSFESKVPPTDISKEAVQKDTKPVVDCRIKQANNGTKSDTAPSTHVLPGSQSLTSTTTAADPKPAVASKSDNTIIDDSGKGDKVKGPKTFDAKNFMEAPLPATNPWNKPAPPEAVKPSSSEQPITDVKKSASDAPTDNKKRPNAAANHHRGAFTRSPRGAKYYPNKHHPSRGDFRAQDRHRKPITSSKSTPAPSTTQSSSTSTQHGQCSIFFVLCNF